MARNGGSRRTPPNSRRPGARDPKRRVAPRRPPEGAASVAADADRDVARVFRLGAVAGATPGKWIAAWRERMPGVPLELVAVDAADQAAALAEGRVDAALVRLPLTDPALHIIPLYDEVPVAVVAVDSHLTAADELTLADLAGEVIITPQDDVLAATVPGAVTPAFAAPADTAEAIATVAAGVGVVLVPMSLARLHARRDVASRPVRDAPVSAVALAWPREGDTPDVQTFVGIVRGRTANSSR